MKSVIIGGTSSLGEYISKELIRKGAEIITVSRAPQSVKPHIKHFQCDVLDQDKLHQVLLEIKKQNKTLSLTKKS